MVALPSIKMVRVLSRRKTSGHHEGHGTEAVRSEAAHPFCVALPIRIPLCPPSSRYRMTTERTTIRVVDAVARRSESRPNAARKVDPEGLTAACRIADSGFAGGCPGWIGCMLFDTKCSWRPVAASGRS
jgi:hypothetical protein